MLRVKPGFHGLSNSRKIKYSYCSPATGSVKIELSQLQLLNCFKFFFLILLSTDLIPLPQGQLLDHYSLNANATGQYSVDWQWTID